MSTVVRAPTSTVQLGYAREEITPPVGIYHRLWGAASHDRATGVHRPLVADVLVLAPLRGDGGPRLVRAFLDLVGLVPSQHTDMVSALAQGASVMPEQVVLTYSHTHSSGRYSPDRIPFPGGELILPYLEELAERLRRVARDAVAELRATTITYATGRSTMGANRDYRDHERGIYACGFNPDVTADDTVLVARYTEDDGRVRGALVNYACHPTTLAWQSSLISPDYVGALRETVEAVSGGWCVFAQGACGDIGPRRGFTGDVKVADDNGRRVAYAALEALQGMGPPGTDQEYAGPVLSGATLGTWHDVEHAEERSRDTVRFAGDVFRVELPLKPRPDRGLLEREVDEWQARREEAEARGDAVAARDAGARAERARRWLGRLDTFPSGETYPLTCAAYRLGDAVWVACGGEPYSALQTELRRRFPDLTLAVSPLFGDIQAAYLLTEDKYGAGLYQEEPSLLARGCLERLIDAIAERIAALL